MNTHFKSFLTTVEEQEWLLTHDHFQVITYVAETDETHVRMNEAYEGKDVCQPFTITQKTGSSQYVVDHYFDYSLDNGATWTHTGYRNFDLHAGETLQLRATLSEREGNGWRADQYSLQCQNTNINNTFEISGNLSSLIDKDYYYKCDCHDRNGLTYDYLFYQMFKGNQGLVSAENLILPYNTTEGIYQEMFQDCVHLQKAPSHLPAKEIQPHAYEFMFWTCSYPEGGVTVDGLTNIPLVKTHCTTGEGAYHGAFGNNELVTSLPQGMDLGTPSDARQVFANTRITKAPKINIIGSNEGHQLMFSYCFALTDASDVHIENRSGMWNTPFRYAFEGCLLDHFEIYGENWPEFDSTTFEGCPASGTFTVPAVTNYDPNDYIGNGIPSGWTIVRAS